MSEIQITEFLNSGNQDGKDKGFPQLSGHMDSGGRNPTLSLHSIWKAESIPLILLPYPSLVQKRSPFTTGLRETAREFSGRQQVQPKF